MKVRIKYFLAGVVSVFFVKWIVDWIDDSFDYGY